MWYLTASLLIIHVSVLHLFQYALELEFQILVDGVLVLMQFVKVTFLLVIPLLTARTSYLIAFRNISL